MLAVNKDEQGELWVLVETVREVVGCPECGVRAKVKERPSVEVGEVAAGGRPGAATSA